MAEALPEDGALITCNSDTANTANAQSFFDRSPHGRKITIRLGPRARHLANIPGRPAIRPGVQ